MFVDVTFDGHVERAIGFLCEDCAAKGVASGAPTNGRSERPARRRVRPQHARRSSVAPEAEPDDIAATEPPRQLVPLPPEEAAAPPVAERDLGAERAGDLEDSVEEEQPAARAITGPRPVAPIVDDESRRSIGVPPAPWKRASMRAHDRRLGTVVAAALSAMAVLGVATMLTKKPSSPEHAQASAAAPTEHGAEPRPAEQTPQPGLAALAAASAAPAAMPRATQRPATTAVATTTAMPFDPPTDAPLPYPASVPFDAAAASRAIAGLADSAERCRNPGDPGGVVKLVITFAPSGRVTSSRVEGPPFAGTTAGSCLAMHFRGATVPAFEGAPAVFTKSVPVSGARRD
jgi:hypothetical protein